MEELLNLIAVKPNNELFVPKEETDGKLNEEILRIMARRYQHRKDLRK